MTSFGAYLKELGVITAEKHDEASQAQVVFGGRMGTNLVELGYLNLSDLGRHLSAYLQVPVAPREWLEHPDSEALATIPRELAEKHSALPLHLEKRTLHLAMLDPRDPTRLDEIAFATGLRVVPYAIAEVQLLAMLEHRYEIKRELRYIDLGREAAQGRYASQKVRPTDVVGDDTAAPISESAIDAEHLNQDLMDETTFSAFEFNSTASADEPPVPEQKPAALPIDEVPIVVSDFERPMIVVPPRSISIAALETELAEAANRDAVSECALRLARSYCKAAALFVVRGGIVSGYRGDGDEMPEQISGIMLPIESDCSITSPSRSGRAFRGRPATHGLDATLLDSLGRREVGEVAVHPIQIRGQVVNLLYTDSGMDRLGDTEFAAVEVVARLASSAYERLILAAKSHGYADCSPSGLGAGAAAQQ